MKLTVLGEKYSETSAYSIILSVRIISGIENRIK